MLPKDKGVIHVLTSSPLLTRRPLLTIIYLLVPPPPHPLVPPPPSPSRPPTTQRCQEGGEVPKETRKFIFSSITDISRVAPPPHIDHIAHSLDCMEFVYLIRSVLMLDPGHRMSPGQALQSPFITMQHLALHTNTQRCERERVMLE